MSFASGTFLINSTGQPVVTGTVISSTAFNALTADLATGLSTCILKDGTQTISANLPMAGFKFTGLAAGSAAGESVRWEQIASSLTAAQWAVAGGSADAITAVYSPVNASLPDGLLLGFRASAANTTTTPTFAPDGLTAHTVTKFGGTALSPGDIAGALAEHIVRYNLTNTRWELLNPAANASTSWTPVLTFATPGDLAVSYTAQVGRCTKIGNMVFLDMNITTSAFTFTTASGQLRITGLPFTPVTLTNYVATGAVDWGGITKANYTNVNLFAASNQAFLNMSISGSGQVQNIVAAADTPTGGSVVIAGSIAYRVS